MIVEFPIVPFCDYGDVPVLTVTAIHHLPLQYKDLCNCIIACGGYSVCCAITSRLSEQACGFLLSEQLHCDLKIKLLWVSGFFSCLVMMDELSFHLQFNWFRPLKAKSFLPAKERQQLEM